MKKTIKTILLVALIILFVTGCSMKSNIGVIVSKDKKVTVKVLSAMDNEMIDYYLGMNNGDDEEQTYTDEERWAYIESSADEDDEYADYTKEKYDQDGYKGYVYSMELGNIDDLTTTDSAEAASFDDLDKNSKLFVKNGNNYSLNLKSSEDSSSEIEEAKSYSEYANFDIKFFITLPNKAVSNNATTVSDDGLTYTWDLLSTQDLQLEFNLNNSGSNTTMVLCIIGAVLVVCAVVAVIVIKKGKGEPKAENKE